MKKNRIYKNIYKLLLLVKGNGIRATSDFVLSHISGDKTPKKMMFLGRCLYLRPKTPDLNVAFECFETEFDCLRGLTNTASNSLIIDAGGYIGTAAIALTELFPQSIVVTIEPSNENFDCLQRNIAEHKRIRGIHGALVATKNSAGIQLIDRKAGEWGFIVETRKAGESAPGSVPSSGDAVTISDILKITGFRDIFVLKMDIEGGERELLIMHQNWLPKVYALFIELHDDLHPDISDVFSEACAKRVNSSTSGEKFLSIRS